MDTQYLMQLLAADYAVAGAVQPSPFFLVPKEVRLLIYEFVFTSSAPNDPPSPLPKSSYNLRPLLACRQFYNEAKTLAFKHTTHHLNWTRPSSCIRHLLDLEPILHASIRHVAITTPAAGLYDNMQPLRYHFDHMRQPFLTLDTLTIILEPPRTDKDQRIQEMNMVLASIWYYKNVNKVVILNVLHREDIMGHPANLGHWTCIGGEGLDVRQMRWRVEFTDFHDYNSGL